MNTQLNFKTRRPLFSANVVTLLVGVVVGLVLAGPSARAQTSTAAAPPPATTPPAIVDSSITVKTNGTVSDPSGAVKVSGDVTITCRRVLDTTTTTNPPIVLLDFDFSRLQGTTGTGKTLITYVTGGNHAEELRPFQASDTIILTVPYFDSTKDMLSASSFMVTAALNFDINTGKLTGATLTYGTNLFKSSGVGSFTVN